MCIYDGMWWNAQKYPPAVGAKWAPNMHKMTALLLLSHLPIQSSQASILNNFVQKDNH